MTDVETRVVRGVYGRSLLASHPVAAKWPIGMLIVAWGERCAVAGYSTSAYQGVTGLWIIKGGLRLGEKLDRIDLLDETLAPDPAAIPDYFTCPRPGRVPGLLHMSSGIGAVRFGDGAVFYYSYSNTSGMTSTGVLFESTPTHYGVGESRQCTCFSKRPEYVQDWTSWELGLAIACRWCLVITDCWTWQEADRESQGWKEGDKDLTLIPPMDDDATRPVWAPGATK